MVFFITRGLLAMAGGALGAAAALGLAKKTRLSEKELDEKIEKAVQERLSRMQAEREATKQ